MTDYHQRLKDLTHSRGPQDVRGSCGSPCHQCEKDEELLAFIDETIAHERGEIGNDFFKLGREKERAALIEKAHEILETYFPKQNEDDPTKPSSNGRGAAMAYMGLLLTHLRGEGLCIFHKDKNCCAYDKKQRSGIQAETGAAFVGGFPEELLAGNRPQEETGCCEKCFKVGIEQGRDELPEGKVWCVDCLCHKPRTEETEKEGASFSGRECVEYIERTEKVGCCPKCRKAGFDRAMPDYCANLGCSCHKENPTPQSREQRLAYLKSKSAEEHPQGHKKCPMCVEIQMLERDISREQGGENEGFTGRFYN